MREYLFGATSGTLSPEALAGLRGAKSEGDLLRIARDTETFVLPALGGDAAAVRALRARFAALLRRVYSEDSLARLLAAELALVDPGTGGATAVSERLWGEGEQSSDVSSCTWYLSWLCTLGRMFGGQSYATPDTRPRVTPPIEDDDAGDPFADCQAWVVIQDYCDDRGCVTVWECAR